MKSSDTVTGQYVDNVADAAGERAKTYVDAGVTAAHHISDRARHFSDRARLLRHEADDYVKENHWLVVGAAVGVGLLAGFLLRRGRSS